MHTKDKYVKDLEVLYEDNHLLVVVKPIDVLSQKDHTKDLDMTEIVASYLKHKYNKPGNVYVGLVHRLDRRVGGVMVFAKTSKAASRLSEAIRNHNFTKTYIAKVEGLLYKDDSINILLDKDEKNFRAVVSEKGKESLLNYRVIKNTLKDTYLYVDLITGRYNQIRVSFAHINHPLVNDAKYGAVEITGDLGLWCYKIAINHPVTKKYIEFVKEPNGSIWLD